jgi:hypothetical protein
MFRKAKLGPRFGASALGPSRRLFVLFVGDHDIRFDLLTCSVPRAALSGEGPRSGLGTKKPEAFGPLASHYFLT